MRRVRAAIVEDTYPAFLIDFFAKRYNGEKENIPEWAIVALKVVGVDLTVAQQGGKMESAKQEYNI